MLTQRRILQTLALVICIYATETIGVETQNVCNNKNSCRECIQSLNCAWCTAPEFKEERCFPIDMNPGCPNGSINSPEKSFELTKDVPLTSDTSTHNANDGSQEFVQLKPQHIKLKLRANEVYSIPLTYSRAAGYPIDLYFLMDLSFSMTVFKDNLSKLGNSLANIMRTLTSDFRLGFGSFIDKVRMPFTEVSKESPCLSNNTCKDAYSYRNVMPLSKDTNRFAYEVGNATHGENIDLPEGGLDAMMQAIVCRKEIGWREMARRMLVFSTDAAFHSAGDGKLAGLIEPNDLKCHLDNQGSYTHAEVLDYPSIGAISRTVKDNYINVIFAVTKKISAEYKLLSEYIEGSSWAYLTNDSSDVLNLVQEQYQQMSSTIQMTDNGTRPIQITYYSACGKGEPEKLTSQCDGVRIGEEIIFNIHISFNSCPSDPRDWRQVIQISPIGINESLIIDFEMLCACECENEINVRSKDCTSSGDLMCGVCECDETHIGAQCECLKASAQNNSKNYDSCHDSTSHIDCSGRGVCSCGVCLCDKHPLNTEKVISGKYCQCDNFSCERHNQKICSGPEQGVCECGKCACKPGWGGTACSCQMSKEGCTPPGVDELCSGQGACECGACKCKTTKEGPYSGQYCELCPTCSGHCDKLKDCVQCQMYKTGKLRDIKDCESNCASVNISRVDNVAFEKYQLMESEKKCTFYDEDNCKFSFIFREVNADADKVRAQKERECVPPVPVFSIIGGVSAAVLFVGLSTLLAWKLITKMQDHREFMRFEKERSGANWDRGDNPLYKEATSNFKNPLFRISRMSKQY